MLISNYIIYTSLTTKIDALIFFFTEKIACIVRIDSCIVCKMLITNINVFFRLKNNFCLFSALTKYKYLFSFYVDRCLLNTRYTQKIFHPSFYMIMKISFLTQIKKYCLKQMNKVFTNIIHKFLCQKNMQSNDRKIKFPSRK